MATATATPYTAAGFLAAILPLVVTPGASLALLLRQVPAGGRRRALPVVLGTATGLYVHACLALAGLSTVVTHSSQVFAAVKYLGAAYLVALGVWTWRTTAPPGPETAEEERSSRSSSCYSQALLANLLNPKAATIYLTVAPQFIDAGQPFAGQILGLATAHVLLLALWLAGCALLIHRAANAFHNPRFARVVTRVASAALVGLGVRTAVV